MATDRTFEVVGLLLVSILIFASSGLKGANKETKLQEISPVPDPLSEKRHLKFHYKTTVDIPEEGENFSVHIPMPQNSPWQQVTNVKLEASNDELEPEIYFDSEYGNRILRYDFNDLNGQTVKLRQTYTVKRSKQELSIPDDYGSTSTLNDSFFRDYLSHNQYVESNQKVKKLVKNTTRKASTYRGHLRVLYDKVRDMMNYDKSGQGWGRGDISYCLEVGEGNCTDFHTLFVSMAREASLPSRFQMGFPIPRTKDQGSIGGYHCWAESYVPDRGWFPVDISEADKHSDRVEFYFGSLDADRVQFTTGKNIPLSTGKKVNYLIYPVADGNDNVNIEKSFAFVNKS